MFEVLQTIEFTRKFEVNGLWAYYFYAITCLGLFPHIENKQRALFKMNRTLKLGGKLVVAHALSSHEIKVHHHNVSSAVANDVMPDEKEMKQLLKSAGFVIHHFNGNMICLNSNVIKWVFRFGVYFS